MHSSATLSAAVLLFLAVGTACGQSPFETAVQQRLQATSVQQILQGDSAQPPEQGSFVQQFFQGGLTQQQLQGGLVQHVLQGGLMQQQFQQQFQQGNSASELLRGGLPPQFQFGNPAHLYPIVTTQQPVPIEYSGEELPKRDLVKRLTYGSSDPAEREKVKLRSQQRKLEQRDKLLQRLAQATNQEELDEAEENLQKYEAHELKTIQYKAQGELSQLLAQQREEEQFLLRQIKREENVKQDEPFDRQQGNEKLDESFGGQLGEQFYDEQLGGQPGEQNKDGFVNEIEKRQAEFVPGDILEAIQENVTLSALSDDNIAQFLDNEASVDSVAGCFAGPETCVSEGARKIVDELLAIQPGNLCDGCQPGEEERLNDVIYQMVSGLSTRYPKQWGIIFPKIIVTISAFQAKLAERKATT